MRKNDRHVFRTLVILLISLTITGCTKEKSTIDKIDLSGQWNFKLDRNNIGKEAQWFNETFEELVELPGTTDENLKGTENDAVEVNYLTRKFIYEGKAWYQREISIPTDWEGKYIELFLERTKATEVWVDDQYFPLRKSLIAPHTYDLSSALKPGNHRLTISVDNSKDLFPVGGSHALASHTQTNWNGIIGKIELRASESVHLKSVKLFPDVKNKAVKAVVQITNPNNYKLEGSLVLQAKSLTGTQAPISTQTFEFAAEENLITLTKFYEMGDDFMTWDEFEPGLYNLSVRLKTSTNKDLSFEDDGTYTFGMLDFKTKGTQFTANDKTILLRGKHDACVFPLTGYPPMTKDEWLRYMKICKEYGLNHVRFHSWTPPEAAFEAADIVGIYLQAELPNWRYFEKNDTAHYNFQLQEGKNILEAYSNHPSFVMLALGNELGGDRERTASVVDSLKSYDSSILYAQGSNNFFWDPEVQPNEDFFVSARTKQREENFVNDIRASFAYIDDPDGGMLNGQFPNTTRNFHNALKYCEVPAIGHETGQYQVMPDFDEPDKYTGVLEARNFEVFRQRMIERNMYPYWKELFMASGKHAAMCYQDDNEISMRTPGFGGFQILDLQDFPGQGTALVGMLDAFMDSKGIITPEKWRQSCAPQTIQAEMPKRIWQNDEVFIADLIAINYGADDLKDEAISWKLKIADGPIITEGKTESFTYNQGKITEAGSIQIPLNTVTAAKKLVLTLSTIASDITNDYEIWVYPPTTSIQKPESVMITTILDASVIKQLNDGKNILLIPDPESIAQNSTGGLFMSDYWCYPMFKQICENNNKPVSPGTLGLLIDNTHPVFNNFPTEDHSNWQWWSLMKKSHPIMIDNTDPGYRPIVQAVDNFERSSKLGVLFEFKVGKGKLFICSTDLSDREDVTANTLLKSILSYMGSDEFVPKNEIASDNLLKVIYGEGVKQLKTRKTNDDSNTSGYDLVE
ncbi:sugar-binding domain-containing protein [Robertkochia solimangrovi]|uniref:sugar-binding domain-containing protein n=1 Tax=Robertkochia solimangrovi TaxID=2213046 RepID=UPI00117CBDAF|nr:sugar-binding domain-containing protein [Robertkochia solimangrovi]TRZ46333.1 hypothetical protein DMZ48_03505 [Robertkochia solimangrovi]